MAKRSKTPTRPSLIPAAAQKLFDRFPVAHVEDAPAYNELVNAVMETLRPKNLIATMLAHDVAYATWRVQQLRSIEAALLTPESTASQQTSSAALAEARAAEMRPWLATPREVLMKRPKDEKERARLEAEFARDHPEAYAKHLQDRAEASERFAAELLPAMSMPKPTPQVISADEAARLAAETFKKNSREIDLISHHIALFEARCYAALREFERYQAGHPAHAQSEVILDAEYTEARSPKRQTRP
jgi:hypothetical protein